MRGQVSTCDWESTWATHDGGLEVVVVVKTCKRWKWRTNQQTSKTKEQVGTCDYQSMWATHSDETPKTSRGPDDVHTQKLVKCENDTQTKHNAQLGKRRGKGQGNARR